MIKKIALVTLLALSGLWLANCTPEENILVSKWNIPSIPPQLYNCPILSTYPKVATLTDSQVAKLLVQLRSNNLTCKQSLDGIKRFLADASNTIK